MIKSFKYSLDESEIMEAIKEYVASKTGENVKNTQVTLNHNEDVLGYAMYSAEIMFL